MQVLVAEPIELSPAPSISAEAIREAELPEGFRVVVQTGKDHELGRSEAGGVTYQKCGGGRRIIRKRIGGA